eukprot:scaffold1306_cov399-Prasinococcus_capsulatus_cf.AAC.12
MCLAVEGDPAALDVLLCNGVPPTIVILGRVGQGPKCPRNHELQENTPDYCVPHSENFFQERPSTSPHSACSWSKH